jgi:hypothetical protein
MTTPSRREQQTIRERARRKAAKGDVSAEIELLYKPLDQWTDEEITRGRPRDRHGNFSGKRPAWLTPVIQAERQRRLRQLMADDLGTFAGDALKIIHEVMMDNSTDESGKPVVPASVRVDAGKYLVDQFMGKATATIDVNAGNTLVDLLGDILVNPDGQPSHMIIEGSVVEDDPSDDEDYDGPMRKVD